ncbi:MAG: FAD binding domain-containing protein [Neomegalonema sp.]|nr:FAD binding domain-containing protein [Neomegalonema sp.]
MYNFEYAKPDNLETAKSLMAREGAQALAGGQSLTPTMKQRLAQPELLVDITGLPELKGVARVDGGVRIGGGVRHVEVERSAEVQAAAPALAQLAGKIGDPQVRNRGTLGGSIANNDPSACYPAAVLALDGVVSTSNGRDIAAADFFQGLYETALEEGELVTAVTFKAPMRAAWMKFPQPASRFSLVGVFVAQFADGHRVAVTGASESGVFRHGDLEAALNTGGDLDSVAVSPSGLIADLHGTPEYRANLIRVQAKRGAAAMV